MHADNEDEELESIIRKLEKALAEEQRRVREVVDRAQDTKRIATSNRCNLDKERARDKILSYPPPYPPQMSS
ncbi:unnamed protein product [Cylicocyclus nassatus]|uniref:Uncharacterized protein n=1 Tax=Cylicocyclus nassatus TaxID=53992 RepID=A0AA36GWH2_CYLNA|nr:unnamed protein product [Cylicocyclus nassatus]